jgi:hypothetical protein
MNPQRTIWTALAAALALSLGALPAAAKGSNKPKVKTNTVHTMNSGGTTAHGSNAHATTSANAASHGSKVKASSNSSGSHSKSHTAKATNTTKAKGSGKHGSEGSSNAGSGDALTNSGAGTRTNAGGNGNGEDNAGGGNSVRTNSGDNDNSGVRSNSNGDGDNGGVPVNAQNKAQQLLAKNDNLRNKCQSRLPAGTDVNAAAAGFKNLGQFVAAVNVSHNLGLDFTALKGLMTGDHPLSLGQSIQRLRGTNSNNAEQIANNAMIQANAQIQASTNTGSNASRTNTTGTNAGTTTTTNNAHN